MAFPRFFPFSHGFSYGFPGKLWPWRLSPRRLSQAKVAALSDTAVGAGMRTMACQGGIASSKLTGWWFLYVFSGILMEYYYGDIYGDIYGNIYGNIYGDIMR